MYLIFDTETTGIPHNKSAPISDLDNWPRVVQLAWQLHDAKGKLISRQNLIIQPDGFDIPYKAEQIHGISTKRALAEGHPLKSVLELFMTDVAQTQVLVGHNIEFDISILGAELIRQQFDVEELLKRDKVDTGIVSTEFCNISGGPGGRMKMPRLTELHEKLFGKISEMRTMHPMMWPQQRDASSACSKNGLSIHSTVHRRKTSSTKNLIWKQRTLQNAKRKKKLPIR